MTDIILTQGSPLGKINARQQKYYWPLVDHPTYSEPAGCARVVVNGDCLVARWQKHPLAKWPSFIVQCTAKLTMHHWLAAEAVVLLTLWRQLALRRMYTDSVGMPQGKNRDWPSLVSFLFHWKILHSRKLACLKMFVPQWKMWGGRCRMGSIEMNAEW